MNTVFPQFSRGIPIAFLNLLPTLGFTVQAYPGVRFAFSQHSPPYHHHLPPLSRND